MAAESIKCIVVNNSVHDILSVILLEYPAFRSEGEISWTGAGWGDDFLTPQEKIRKSHGDSITITRTSKGQVSVGSPERSRGHLNLPISVMVNMSSKRVATLPRLVLTLHPRCGHPTSGPFISRSLHYLTPAKVVWRGKGQSSTRLGKDKILNTYIVCAVTWRGGCGTINTERTPECLHDQQVIVNPDMLRL
ncbi:hypothetical protein RRG08_011886 [Elysia crispata]|uniref:Uncharacterized protein n=1 Tax=Elysia crispata TaxID=231223 RepID=A0AAE1DJS3_9GAST|nr:hypothetical protein RRG08_011886 [Elysia crispata]